MDKTVLTVKVDKVALEQAKAILEALSVPMDVAINMYLHAIVNQNGIPFVPKLGNSFSSTKKQEEWHLVYYKYHIT